MDDVVQDVIVLAWCSAERGRYRPPPEKDADRALLAWLHGITWRAAWPWVKSTGPRREVPSGLRAPVSADEPWPPTRPPPDLLIKEAPIVRAYLGLAGLAAQDADDVWHEVLIDALHAVNQNRFRPDPHVALVTALRRWLLGITSHRLKHTRRRVSCIAPPEYHDTDIEMPSLEARAKAWDVLRALAKLRPELRDVIALEAQGWSVQEIAVHLAIPCGTVASRVRAARRLIAGTTKRRP